MINAGQVRAARALVAWSQDVLAEKTNLSKSTLQKIETGLIASPRAATMEAVQKVFESAGVEFLPNSGLRMRDPMVTTLEGKKAYKLLLDDVYETLRGTGGEMCIFGLEEKTASAELENDPQKKEEILAHIERLKKEKIREKLLICEGDTNYLAPQYWYRWMPKEYFEPYPIYVYGTKVAIIYWGPPFKAIVYENSEIANSMHKIFDFVWSKCEPARMPEELEQERT